jgi:hypothetical protein
MKGRKVIALLVTTLILINSAVLLVFAQSAPDTSIVVYGDVDKDGNFDSDDYAIFRQYLLGMIGSDRVPATADVDGNGQYNSDDYAYMRQYLLGMIQVFPAEKSTPFPTDTPSPTSTPIPTDTIAPSVPPIIIPTSYPTPAALGSLSMNGEKVSGSTGDFYKVTLNVQNIANFAGYQVNLKYDPNVLMPVYPTGSQFKSTSIVESGTLLTNNNFSPLKLANHDLANGILNFGIAYVDIRSYRNFGSPETSGSIGVIYFKVLKYTPTSIRLTDSDTLPSGLNGTSLYDWNSTQILAYTVFPLLVIYPVISTITPVPTSTPIATTTPVPYTHTAYNTVIPAYTPSTSQSGDIIL